MSKRLFLPLYAMVALIYWGLTPLHAQPKGDAVLLGQSFHIQSTILGEERPYMVYLPDNYDPNGNPLAVMYLMDGAGHFLHTSGIVSFLANQGRIPEMMIVGIPNTADRTKDLTPSIEKNEDTRSNFPTGGGADNTLAFIKTELIPHIEANYHTNSYKVLVGHSFGGIFAVNALLAQPDLFDAYISISPSMWWDEQHLVDRAETFLNEHKDLKGFFYMTMGNEGGAMLGGAMKLAALFEEKAPESFGWDFKVMEEETHGSIPHRSTYYGLEAIFKDWYAVDLASLFAEGGMEAIDEYHASLEEKLGYRKQLSEQQVNNFGYRFMSQNQLDKALKLFQKNAEDYPDSYNVWDSMAEAYMKMEDKESAIKYYKKSLELHPGNQNAVAMLKQMDVDHDPMKQQLDLPPKKLKQYVGKYTAIQGLTLEITIEEGQLMGSATPVLPKQKLLAFPNHRFLLSKMNAPITFHANEDQKIIGYEVQMGIGQAAQGKKIE